MEGDGSHGRVIKCVRVSRLGRFDLFQNPTERVPPSNSQKVGIMDQQRAPVAKIGSTAVHEASRSIEAKLIEFPSRTVSAAVAHGNRGAIAIVQPGLEWNQEEDAQEKPAEDYRQ
jgi:hypothetical protein